MVCLCEVPHTVEPDCRVGPLLSSEFTQPVMYPTAHPLPLFLGASDTEMGQILTLILRLNDVPVKQHKEDVGERTSIRLFFPDSALPNPLENNDNDALMVFVPFKPLDFLWLREVLLKTRNKVRCL